MHKKVRGAFVLEGVVAVTQDMSREQSLMVEAMVSGLLQVSVSESSHYKRTGCYNLVHCGLRQDNWKSFGELFKEFARFLPEHADKLIENIAGFIKPVSMVTNGKQTAIYHYCRSHIGSVSRNWTTEAHVTT